MKFREKNDIYVDLFLCLSQISRGFKVLHKIPDYFQGSRSQNKFQTFQGFQGAVGTLKIILQCTDHLMAIKGIKSQFYDSIINLYFFGGKKKHFVKVVTLHNLSIHVYCLIIINKHSDHVEKHISC